jgi:hypothetical protein
MPAISVLSPALLHTPPPTSFFQRGHGYWLLLLIPASAVAVYFLHLQLVDLEWMYYTNLRFSNDDQTASLLAQRLAAKSPMWHFGKNGLWPIILLCAETICIAMLCMVIAQLSGTTARLRDFFIAGLWSKAVYLLTAMMIYARLLIQEDPLRILSKDLDVLSWNSLLGLQGDRPLQFLTCNQGPMVIVSIAILALAYRQLTGRSWTISIVFGALPYTLWLAGQYYLFAVVFK